MWWCVLKNQVGKKLGEMWRAATDATKKKFNDMSEKRKKVSRVLKIDTNSFIR
jgi:hypothetical protein